MTSNAPDSEPAPRAPLLPPGWTVDTCHDALRIRCVTPDEPPALHDDGWRLRHIEDDLHLTELSRGNDVRWPTGCDVQCWSEEMRDRAYAAYVESFRDRPGFPGWSAQRWLAWATDYASFRPDLSCVVTDPEGVVAYALAALEPDACWIVQMGVVPRRRRQGVGRALLARVGASVRAAGASELRLSVNVDNPGARALYERAGFRFLARRAVFEPGT